MQQKKRVFTAETFPNTDEELNGFLRKKRRISILGLLVAVLGGILLGTCFLSAHFAMIIPGFALLTVGILMASSARRTMKRAVSEVLVKQALCTVFDDVHYEAESRLSDRVICNTDMGFPFSFNEIWGSDYVAASYKGLSIEMSDVRLVEITYTTDSKGNTRRHSTTVFEGPWMICDFGKELSADLRLSERTALGKMFAKGGAKTESEEFNKRFYIQTRNEHEMFYVLTPHMMEYILQMDDKGGGSTYLRFVREGKVHIAINSRHNSFEVGYGEADAAALRAKFEGEIRYITDLIDELRLVDTLFANRHQ